LCHQDVASRRAALRELVGSIAPEDRSTPTTMPSGSARTRLAAKVWPAATETSGVAASTAATPAPHT